MSLDGGRLLAEIASATARDWLLIRMYRGAEDVMAQTPDKVAALVDSARVLASLAAMPAVSPCNSSSTRDSMR